MQNVYTHTYEEVMQESDYKNDHYIIIMMDYEVDCYFKQNGKIELVGIFEDVIEASQAIQSRQ